MVDIAKSEKYGTRGWIWGSSIVSIATVPMGVVAVLLAMCWGRGLAALVALSLSFFRGVELLLGCWRCALAPRGFTLRCRCVL